jgi:arylsulfatase A-like enzyme
LKLDGVAQRDRGRAAAPSAAAPATTTASGRKPNILLIIMADDIGWFDVGAYNRGMMGGAMPNIDRIAAEGTLHTDHYGQASCTAGRAAFITGIPMRTGLTSVGMPGAKQAMQAEDPSIADLLKPLGYMTCQTGKNHLGDRNEHLPPVHVVNRVVEIRAGQKTTNTTLELGRGRMYAAA